MMWYKTAKQGSVWSRIAPDAEELFDKLLDESTVTKNDKKYDYKFKEQLTKHFNNVYQKLKEYYRIKDQKPLQNLSQVQHSNVQDSNELIDTKVIPDNKN